MELFDVVKAVFAGRPVPRADRARNAFIFNRMMSARYPLPASALNMMGGDPSRVVDCWAALVGGSGSVPPWVFAKTAKKDAPARKKPERAALELWMEVNGVGESELAACVAADADGVYKEATNLFKCVNA